MPRLEPIGRGRGKPDRGDARRAAKRPRAGQEPTGCETPGRAAATGRDSREVVGAHRPAAPAPATRLTAPAAAPLALSSGSWGFKSWFVQRRGIRGSVRRGGGGVRSSWRLVGARFEGCGRGTHRRCGFVPERLSTLARSPTSEVAVWGRAGSRSAAAGSASLGVVAYRPVRAALGRRRLARRARRARRAAVGRGDDAVRGVVGVPHRRRRERAPGLPYRRRREQRPDSSGTACSSRAASSTGYVDTVFFSGQTQTGCGVADAAVGPFYCPADKLVYIDLGFFDAARVAVRRRDGPVRGGVRDRARVRPPRPGPARRARRTSGATRQGPESKAVRSELQADCYAGVWAAHAVDTGLIEQLTQADINQGLRRRRRDRRRPDPGAHAGPGATRDVDARLVRAAPPLVLARLRERQAGRLRHLLRLDLAVVLPGDLRLLIKVSDYRAFAGGVDLSRRSGSCVRDVLGFAATER